MIHIQNLENQTLLELLLIKLDSHEMLTKEEQETLHNLGFN